jgi:hypothetical protein
MATITGQRGTDDLSTFRVHHDLARRILELEPSAQPLIVFLNNIYNGARRVRTKTPKFRWSEFELDDRFDAINDATPPTSTDTVWTVDSTDGMYPEALIKVPRTKEVVRVVTVDSGTQVTVVRSYGAAAAVALVDDEPLFVIAQAREEGDVSKPARAREPVEKVNYTQIFRRWVDETGTTHSSDQDTQPHDWRFQQAQNMIEHQKDKELAFWFGTPGEETGVSHPVRTTGGVEHFATENNVGAGGGLTELEFENWLRPGLRYGNPTNKILVVSRLVASVLNQFSSTKLQTSVGDKVYGVSVNRWLSAHGEVKIVSHPLFEGLYEGYAFLLDLDKGNVRYRYLHGQESPGRSRDTHMVENVQENDRDGRKDEIKAECGLQFGLPKAHAVLTGVTTAA